MKKKETRAMVEADRRAFCRAIEEIAGAHPKTKASDLIQFALRTLKHLGNPAEAHRIEDGEPLWKDWKFPSIWEEAPKT